MTKTNQQISDLPSKLSRPAQRALAGAGISSLGQLAGYKEDDIRNLHGIRPNALQLLRKAMTEKGLSFAGKAAKI